MVDAVFEAIHSSIESGDLQPGDPLPSQDSLAEQYGASRNTVREAINKLAALGWVTVKHGVGTSVSPTAGSASALLGHLLLEPITVREFLEARAILERSMVRLAAVRADSESLVSIRTTLVRQQAAVDSADEREFVVQDAAFHLAIARASGNALLARYLETTRGLLERFLSAGAQESSAIPRDLVRHRRILAAVEARDPDRAESEMLTHLREAYAAAESGLDAGAKSEIGLES